MPTDAEIEAGARALFADEPFLESFTWDDLTEEGTDGKRNFRETARIVLAAAEAVRPQPPSRGAALIAAERARQIEVEGWTPEHDAGHRDGALGWAAEAYLHHANCDRPDWDPAPGEWPWAESDWKPTTLVRNFVKAGALIAAELDRLVPVEDTKEEKG